MESQNWDDLIQDHLDGKTTIDAANSLSEKIVSDPEIRSRYLRAARIHAALTEEVLAPEQQEEPARRIEEKETAFWRHAGLPGLAALIAVCLALWIFLGPHQKKTEAARNDAIATIESLSGDVVWGADQQFEEGTKLDKGWVQLERGKIRLVFRSGATLEAEGPAALGIDTPMRVYLDFGKVNVHAPESARDFIVATESMEVVDLGTRFEVDVDKVTRESNVSVSEGLVDIHLGSRGTYRTIHPLEAGHAARVDASGKIVHLKDRNKPASSNKNRPPQLLAHWTFDENEDDGLITTNHLPVFVPGVRGQALKFSDNQFVNLDEQLATLRNLGSFTFSAWVCDPDDTRSMVFSISDGSEQHRIQFYLSRSYIRYGWQDGTQFDSISGRIDGWQPGRWYHVAITLKDGFARLYRNGELVASGSSGSKIGTPILGPSLVKNASHASLGRLEDGEQGQQVTNQWFEGKLDDVRIYTGSLEHNGIRSLFENPDQ